VISGPFVQMVPEEKRRRRQTGGTRERKLTDGSFRGPLMASCKPLWREPGSSGEGGGSTPAGFHDWLMAVDGSAEGLNFRPGIPDAMSSGGPSVFCFCGSRGHVRALPARKTSPFWAGFEKAAVAWRFTIEVHGIYIGTESEQGIRRTATAFVLGAGSSSGA